VPTNFMWRGRVRKTTMAKIILEFDPVEEREEAHIAIKAGSYFSALSNIAEYLRGLEKHSDLTKEQAELLTNIRTTFNEETEDLDIY
jgi:hypothetical protein